MAHLQNRWALSVRLVGAWWLLLLIRLNQLKLLHTGLNHMHLLLLRVGAAATAWIGHGLQAAKGCLAGPLADNSNSLSKSLQLLHGSSPTR